MPVTATTTLPDVAQPTLDNGVEDEIGVSWSDVINYGDYRCEFRETGASTWLSGFVVGEATTSDIIPNLEDGEEYEIRLRTETEHRTGSWTTSVSIVTKFPGLTDFSIDATTQTSVDLSWTDNADNEDGIDIDRRQAFDDGYGDWSEIAALDPNTESYADDSVVPETDYQYRATIYTEHISHTTTSITTTADSTDNVSQQSGSSGYRVRIEHSSGAVHRPTVADGVEYSPTLNGRPSIRIPVKPDDKWQSPGFEDANLSVWQDGQILPIDTLETIEQRSGEYVLVGSGGQELETRVQAGYSQREAHLAAKDLLQSNTGYGTNVDAPDVDGQPDTLMQSADSESELTDALASAISDSQPLTPANGGLETLQSNVSREGENPDRSSGTSQYYSDGSLSGGDGRGVFSSDSSLEWDGSFDYRIPASAVGVKVRIPPTTDAKECEFVLTVDGTEYVLDYLTGGEAFNSVGWVDVGSGVLNGSGYDGPDIPAGSAWTLTLRATGTNGSDVGADLVSVYDSRWSYLWDNDNGGSGGYLDGPQSHPDAYTVSFDKVSTPYNVIGAAADLGIDNTSNGQRVQVRNADSTAWQPSDGSETNTDSVSVDFSSAGSYAQLRVDLSRYGTRTDATPQTGYRPQTLDWIELRADLEDTPVLVGESYDADLEAILNEIADYGNFIWELTRQSADQWTVEWTQPGQRSGDQIEDIASYDLSKSTESQYQKVVVKGGKSPVRGEAFTANHGTAVSLDNSDLIGGSQIVRDPSTGTVYSRGDDYELDRNSGSITTLSAGSMTDGESYEIDYEHKVSGSYTAESAGSDPNTLVRTIPALSSQRSCEQAALYLVQQLQDPLWEGSVSIPTGAAGRSLVDDLFLPQLPDGVGMEIQRVEQSSGETQLTLGSRQGIGEIVSDINQRVEAVSQRV